MNWSEIERIGREIYELSNDWKLSAIDAVDPNVMKIRLNKKGPRGGWLRGKENEFSGYIPEYKKYMAQRTS